MKHEMRALATAIVVCVVSTVGCVNDLIDEFAGWFGRVVPVTEFDATPPSVTLTIPGHEKIVLDEKSQPVNVSVNHSSSFFIIAAAEDPEGVKQVGVTGQLSVDCVSGTLNYMSTTGLVANAMDTAPGGTALTRRWLPYLVDSRAVTCDRGGTPQRMRLVINATGTNFSDVSAASAAASFEYNP